MEKNNFPRILLIGSTPYKSNATSRSMAAYFSSYPKECLRQIYSNTSKPTKSFISSYYQITDRMMLNKYIHKNGIDHAIYYEKDMLDDDGISATQDTNSRLYKAGLKKTGIVNLGRSAIWKNEFFWTDSLVKWIEEFKPEMVFLTLSADMYLIRIAKQVIEAYKIPLIINIQDDIYFYEGRHLSILNKIYFSKFRKEFDKLMAISYGQIYICDLMRDKYNSYFHKNGITMFQNSTLVEANKKVKKCEYAFTYAGGIYSGRHKGLIEIANALHQINKGYFLDVYLPKLFENKITRLIQKCPNIKLHYGKTYDEIKEITQKSTINFIVEGQNKKDRSLTRYSLSTKTADCIASSSLTMVYAHKENGVFQYINDNQIGISCDKKQELVNCLKKAIKEANDSNSLILKNAKNIAKTNHSAKENTEKIQSYIRLIMDKTDYRNVKFSVLMTSYINSEVSQVKLAIESVLNNTLKPEQFIIVKDGPLNDKVNELIDTYRNKNPNLFTIVSLKKNCGSGPASQVGIEASRNEYIARQDDDDYSYKDRFEKSFKAMIENNADLLGANADNFVDEVNNITSHYSMPEKNEEIIAYSKGRCPMVNATIIYRKSQLLAVGGYRDMSYAEDYDIFYRLLKNHVRAYNVQESLVAVRSDNRLFERRGGKQYIKSMIRFNKVMYKDHWISFYQYFKRSTANRIVGLLPNKLRRYVYVNFLRKKTKYPSRPMFYRTNGLYYVKNADDLPVFSKEQAVLTYNSANDYRLRFKNLNEKQLKKSIDLINEHVNYDQLSLEEKSQFNAIAYFMSIPQKTIVIDLVSVENKAFILSLVHHFIKKKTIFIVSDVALMDGKLMSLDDLKDTKEIKIMHRHQCIVCLASAFKNEYVSNCISISSNWQFLKRYAFYYLSLFMIFPWLTYITYLMGNCAENGQIMYVLLTLLALIVCEGYYILILTYLCQHIGYKEKTRKDFVFISIELMYAISSSAIGSGLIIAIYYLLSNTLKISPLGTVLAVIIFVMNYMVIHYILSMWNYGKIREKD